MLINTVLEPLLHSPKLFDYYQQLRDAVVREQQYRQEFYATMTEQEKIEFINGEIIRQSPVKIEHERVSGRIYVVLYVYATHHQLGYAGHEKMLVSLTRNDYEPDICYWGRAKADTFKAEQMHFPAPDLIVEVLSPSTEKTDRETKFADYGAHGVQEYWIIDPGLEVVEQYVLQGEQYTLIQKTDSGVLRSQALTGLHLSVPAIFDEQAHLHLLWNIKEQSPRM